MAEEKALSPVAQFEHQIAAYSRKIESLLPDHVTKEKFMRITVMAVQKYPDLLRVNRDSLLQSVLDCAQDGLIPDGREAALVKFGDQAAYMPMIAGVHKKIRQSGELESIMANVVYDGDKFEYWNDEEGPHFKHIPNLENDSDKVKAVYAMARTKDGGKYLEVMTVREIEKVRNVSKAKNNGPWSQWWEEMAKKTVTRRLAKRLPMSTDIERVIMRDDQFYDMTEQTRDVTPKESTAETVKEKLKAKTGKTEEKPVAAPPKEEKEEEQPEIF